MPVARFSQASLGIANTFPGQNPCRPFGSTQSRIAAGKPNHRNPRQFPRNRKPTGSPSAVQRLERLTAQTRYREPLGSLEQWRPGRVTRAPGADRV